MPLFCFTWGLLGGFGCLVVCEYTLGEFGASCGLILSFRGYLGVLLGLVFGYLSIWGLFLQIWVVFGVLEFGGLPALFFGLTFF